MRIADYLAELPDDPKPGPRRARLSLERRVLEIEGFTGKPLVLSRSAWSAAAALLPRLTEDQLAVVRRTRDVGAFLPADAPIA